MKFFGSPQRSWRRNRKRAVSPIIATILLVAITVVLAAVLYILIQNYTKTGSASTPLGTAYGLGNSVNSTGTTTCASGTFTGGFAGVKFCYTIPVSSASSSVTLSALAFQAKSSTGIVFSGTLQVAVLSLSGATIGTYAAAGWSYAAGFGGGTSVTTQMTVVVGLSAGATAGSNLISLGSGSFSGSVTTALNN